jgi:predicted metal-dependent HD superfamily phosphohydrolase
MQALLQRWNFSLSPTTILDLWNAPGRYYHSETHLRDLLKQIETGAELSEIDRDKLQLAAIFHDIIYNPVGTDNEERSVQYMIDNCDNPTTDHYHIAEIIMDTKKHIPSSPLSEIFWGMDMNIMNRNLQELLVWEDGIHKEYAQYVENYTEKRLKFLKTYVLKYPNLQKLIDHLTSYSI